MTTAPRGSNKPRRPYRPPIGIPLPRQNKAGSAIASVLLHALIIFLLVGPIIAHDILVRQSEGAGGKGPAGGGGGGRRGGAPERATYVEMAPPPPPPAQKAPTPTPQVIPPPVVKPPEPRPQLTPADPIPLATSTPLLAVAGTGGTGNDGSNGSGPGRGGGIGSGEGTGRGSGNGPGTGGGAGRVYPPYVTNLALLPIPVPSRVRPYTMTAVFEVDETGHARLLHFNETRDADYNKKIRAMLQEVRFRPAVRADGTPVKDTTSIIASAPR
jgi:protein TonB